MNTIDTYLAQFAADTERWDAVGDYAEKQRQAVIDAEAAGRVRARMVTREALAHDADVKDAWLRLLINGPDGGWDVRGSDVRRAFFDGVREEIRDMKWTVL